jgi:hypothetical protein
MTPDEIDRLTALVLAGLDDPQAQEDFVRELSDALVGPFADGMMAGTEAIGGAIDLDLANERAVAWARDYAAQLVTQVDETSKTLIREMVSRELDAGVTMQDLTDDLMQAFGDFAEYRAERIARTETANAYNQGTIGGYRESGVEYVEVLDGPGCLPDGHDDGADPPDPDVYGLQEEAEANGQTNCVRAFAAVVPPPPDEEE